MNINFPSGGARGHRGTRGGRGHRGTRGHHHGHGTGAQPKSQKYQQILELIPSRFDRAKNLLNLSGVVNDSRFNSIISNFDLNNEKTASFFFGAFEEQFISAGVQSLDLSNNRLITLKGLSQPLSKLAQCLKNLNLANNSLSSFSELDYIKSLQLDELYLAGNNMYQNLDPNTIIREVKARFPTLKRLDGSELPNIVSGAAVPTSTISLPPVNSNSFYDENTQFLNDFVQSFLDAFDKIDSSIMDAYSPDAFFSLTINIGQWSVAPDPQASKDNFHRFLPLSRNLLRVRQEQAKNMIIYGKNVIPLISSLNTTVHYKDSIVIDAVFLNLGVKPVIFLTIHGKMQLAGFERSFDRVMILMTPTPSSRWPVTIANDQLHIRPCSQMYSDQTSSNIPAQQALSQLNDIQRQQCNQLSQQTRMNAYYSYLCLSNANWDYNAALNLFHTYKNTLPQEAFHSP
jgi:hypothetical protein